MSTIYLQAGEVFTPYAEDALNLKENLPPGNFIVKRQPMTEKLYFEKVQDFPPMNKVYGDSLKRAKRILNTYKTRPASTGALFTGEKGSGKSMLAKQICLLGALEGIPTIVINEELVGDDFNKFIQDIDQPCIVLFDEFEKTFKKENQEKILSLLDGAFPSKKLFILTVNDMARVDSHLINRPGRIFYLIQYTGVSEEFIIEYCNDTLMDHLKVHVPKIVDYSRVFGALNFDILKALVEEMNRYDEEPLEAMEMLNMRPTESGKFNITVTHPNGQKIRERTYWPSGVWEGNPLTTSHSMGWSPEKDDQFYRDDDSFSIKCEPHHLVRMIDRDFEFRNDEGFTILFSRVTITPFKFSNF